LNAQLILDNRVNQTIKNRFKQRDGKKQIDP